VLFLLPDLRGPQAARSVHLSLIRSILKMLHPFLCLLRAQQGQRPRSCVFALVNAVLVQEPRRDSDTLEAVSILESRC
jgi:hypothetical protein